MQLLHELLPVSPLQLLTDATAAAAGVRLWIKRDDQLAPTPDSQLVGNKCRKLQYNLAAARRENYGRLLTLGGPYSNHLAAVAAAGERYGFETVGLVRGEPVDNPTLRQARSQGMRLHFVDRAAYRRRHNELQIQQWLDEHGPAYWLPEGGTNALALRGCAQLAAEINKQMGQPPDYLLAACGTGGTLAGLIHGMQGQGEVVGISVLKGHFMTQEVQRWLSLYPDTAPTNWHLNEDYHDGGYARLSQPGLAFIHQFRAQHGILLDPVYTGKLARATIELLAQGYFRRGSEVVMVHSGGLQGWRSGQYGPVAASPPDTES